MWCIPNSYVGWGTFGIQGTTTYLESSKLVSIGCINILNKYAVELYSIVEEGTPVKVYRGPYGAFGKGYRNLDFGNRGPDVFEVEKRLKAQDYYKDSIEGIYNDTLRIAVHTFQKAKGLEVSDVLGKSFYEKLGIILEE